MSGYLYYVPDKCFRETGRVKNIRNRPEFVGKRIVDGIVYSRRPVSV